MAVNVSAPLLSRVKSWQLVWLGISGWITLYSAALLCWGGRGFIVGNTQGGCFATAMSLAGLEARRFQKARSVPMDPFQWTRSLTTEQLNQTLAQALKRQSVRVEAPHPTEARMGFGLRVVSAGRTLVFETARWQEPVIDLLHARTTEENRHAIRADLAIIVGAGKPDHETHRFVQNHPVKLLAGQELKELLAAEMPPVKNVEPQAPTAAV